MTCKRCTYIGCSGTLSGHFLFKLWLFNRNYGPKAQRRRLITWWTALDYSKIDDVQVAGIDFSDYPDFVDAYIIEATYKGRPMTEAELERLNEDHDFIYAAVERRIY